MATLTNCAAYGVAARTTGNEWSDPIGSAAYGAWVFRDIEFSGIGVIEGVTKLKLTNGQTIHIGSIPVRLHEQNSGLVVRQTISADDGSYRFDYLSQRYSYYAIAFDISHQNNAVAVDYELPGNPP